MNDSNTRTLAQVINQAQQSQGQVNLSSSSSAHRIYIDYLTHNFPGVEVASIPETAIRRVFDFSVACGLLWDELSQELLSGQYSVSGSQQRGPREMLRNARDQRTA